MNPAKISRTLRSARKSYNNFSLSLSLSLSFALDCAFQCNHNQTLDAELSTKKYLILSLSNPVPLVMPSLNFRTRRPASAWGARARAHHLIQLIVYVTLKLPGEL